jgi:hypothetical protein
MCIEKFHVYRKGYTTLFDFGGRQSAEEVVRGRQWLEGRARGGGRSAMGGGGTWRVSGSAGRGTGLPRLAGAGGVGQGQVRAVALA